MNTRLPFDLKEWALRIGLVGTALVLLPAGADWIQSSLVQRPAGLVFPFLAWGAGTALLLLGSATRIRSWYAWLVLLGLLAVLLGYAGMSWLNYTPLTSSHTDNEMIGQFAVEALKHGQNPYAWNFSDMLRVYRDQGLNYTPFLDGAIQNRVTYPALPTLLLLSFNFLGIGSGRVVVLIFHLALLVMMFLASPSATRPLILFPMFIFKDYIFLSLAGTQDMVWSALLVGVILAWKRPTWRAVLFGLACSYRQQPWFVAPFLLIYLWLQEGSRAERLWQMAYFVAVSAGVFLLTNLPFIVWDPSAWFLGAVEPAYSLFNVYGQGGLAALSQFGLVQLPREAYTLLQASSYVLLLVVYWRHARSIGNSFWIFPALFFWFYYRGLSNYWIYWIPPLLISVVNGNLDSIAPRVLAIRGPRAWVTAALAGAVLTLDLIVVLGLASQQVPIGVEIQYPLETTRYGETSVNQLQVTVTNRGKEAIIPRFAVQRDPAIQSLPWTINSGPEQLQPGDTGDYVVSADTASRTFPLSMGAQLVVTDAKGGYESRQVVNIPPDRAFNNPTAGIYGPVGQDPAVPDTQTLVQTALDHPANYFARRGEEYRLSRNFELARQSYEQALGFDNTNPDLFFGLAESDFWTGDFSDAAVNYSASIGRGYREPALAYKGMGWSLYNVGKFADARQSFEQAIRLDQKLADAYNGLGWVDVQTRDCIGAAGNFQQAQRLDPTLDHLIQALPICEASVKPTVTPNLK